MSAAAAPAKTDNSAADDGQADGQTNEADSNHCNHYNET